MKIAIEADVLCMPASGVAKSLIYLINETHYQAPEIEFITFTSKKQETFFNFKTNLCKYKQFFGLENLYLKNKLADCDFIYYHWNGGIRNNIGNNNSIMMLHDILPLEIPNYFKNETSRNNYIKKTQVDINNSKLIFTPSEYSKKRILEEFDVTCKIIVIPHGITLPQLNIHKTNKSEYYLYLGGYDKRKGIEHIIKAFIQGGFKEKLYIIGKQNYISKDFENLIQKAIKLDIVQELGYVAENELPQLIHNAKALLYPSKYEGFGLPPLEAMSLGCPVITTKYTSIPEICDDACIYIEPQNIQEIIDAINTLNNNEAYRNELINNGYKRAKLFSWEKSASDFISNLYSLL